MRKKDQGMELREKVCTRCVLNASFPGIEFDEEGVCSVCRSYERAHAGSTDRPGDLAARRRDLDRLCADAKAKRRRFDVLVPLSGGKDSMYVLYRAVRELSLKPLAFTMDNGYLTQVARDNIDRACRILGVEHVYYRMDPALMRGLFRLFMEKTGYFCSICMRAIGMATERVAEMYDAPLVFGGSAASVELPTAPSMFQSGEPGFIRNVLKGEALESAAGRLLYEGSLKRRIGYRLFWWGPQKRVRLCAWINLPDYLEWDYDTMFKTIRDELGWSSPTGGDEEHVDCALHKASAYVHDRRWKGSDIRTLTCAGLIHSGQQSREAAMEKLRSEPGPVLTDADLRPFLDDIGLSRERFDQCIDQGPRYVEYRPKPRPARRVLSAVKGRVFRMLGLRPR